MSKLFWIIVATVSFVIAEVFFFVRFGWSSCPDGFELHGEVCASDAVSHEIGQAYVPSTELPPRGHGEEVHADNPPSLIGKDSDDDKAIEAAKVKAGLPKEWTEK